MENHVGVGQRVYFKAPVGIAEYVECGIVKDIFENSNGEPVAYIETLAGEFYDSEFMTVLASGLYTPDTEEGAMLEAEYNKVEWYDGTKAGKCVWNAVYEKLPEIGRCVVGLKKAADGGFDAVVCESEDLEGHGCDYWIYVPDFNGLMISPAEQVVYAESD